MTGCIKGKISLVTGAGSGIGRATALAFAREGAKVAVVDVDFEGGRETVSKIKESGGDAIFIKTDVSQVTEVESMVKETVVAYGRLDIAFNNAGVSSPGVPAHEHSLELWMRTLDVNLTGVWLCMKYEIEQMLKQGRGSIVNASSGAGLGGYRGGAAYSATKHGIIGLTKTAALEYIQKGIRINAVCPGITRTPMLERVMTRSPEMEARFVAQMPIGRLGMPEEIAEAVVWLSSDAASLVTGLAMPVDGGLSAQSIGPVTTR